MSASVLVAKLAKKADTAGSKPLPPWLRRIPNPLFLCFTMKKKVTKLKEKEQKKTIIANVGNMEMAPLANIDSVCKFESSSHNEIPTQTETVFDGPQLDKDEEEQMKLLNAQNTTRNRLTYRQRISIDMKYPSFIQHNENNDVKLELTDPDSSMEPIDAKASKEKCHKLPSLFNCWTDVSHFVDLTLMTTAAMIAAFSPIVLFIILPWLASHDILSDSADF